MTTVAEIKKQYPDLLDLDDDQVVDALHQAFYSDMPRDDLAKSLGIKAAVQPAQPRTWGAVATDIGISALKGTIGVPEAAVGLADLVTGGRAGRAAEELGFRPKEAKAILDEGYSPEQKAAFQKVQAAEGLGDTFMAAIRNPSVVGHSVIESLPAMGAGGVVARGGLALAPKMGAIAAGAMGEGTVGAGMAAEQIRQQSEDGRLTGVQSGLAGATGVLTGTFGMLGGKIAQKLGIADVDTMLAGAATNPAVRKGVVRSALEGAFAEGVLEELPQSVSEQVLQNVALGKPLDEGVNQAIVLGLLSGAAMGGGANVVSSFAGGPPATDPVAVAADAVRTELVPEVGALSKAANIATEGRAQTIEQTGADPMAPPVEPAEPAPEPVDDPMADRIGALPDDKREEALRAYTLLSRDDVPQGVKQYNRKLLDGLLKENGLQPGATPETKEKEPAAITEPAQAAIETIADKPASRGQFATAQEAQDYISTQRRGASVTLPQALPIEYPDNSHGVATAGSPDFTEAQRQAKARTLLESGVQEGDLLNPLGEPFKTRMAANRFAKTDGGEVVPVTGGFVVRPGVKSVTDNKTGTEPTAKTAKTGKTQAVEGAADGGSGQVGEPAAGAPAGDAAVQAVGVSVTPNIPGKPGTAIGKVRQLTVSFAGKSYPVQSIQDAQNKWEAFRDSADGGSQAGASQIGNGVQITDEDGNEVARVSYNGRIWGPGENGKLLLEPGGRQVSKNEPLEFMGFKESGGVWSQTHDFGPRDKETVDIKFTVKQDGDQWALSREEKPKGGKSQPPIAMGSFGNQQAAVDAYSAYSRERVYAEQFPAQGKKTSAAGDVTDAKPKPLPNATAPEQVTTGVDDRELGQIVAEFNAAQQAEADSEEKVTHVFDAPAKKDIFRLADKVKVYQKDKGWMTVAEAKTSIEEWKAKARAQGGANSVSNGNANRIVLSLFDLTGSWSKPWEEAGYQVYRFDIQDDPDMGDVNKFDTEFFNDNFGDFEGQDVYAILAACPCTDFAVSGARHFAAKDKDGRTVASVKLVHQALATVEYFKPAVWAVENPVGRIESLGGLPPWRLSFDPNHLGDPYTKKTLIWGRFNGDLPIAPVEPTEGSKMHKLYGGKSMKTKNARSETPEGFSYGFFQANNAVDNPVLAIANKYDRLDRDLIEKAVAAGVTEQQISDAVEDFYYQDLDDEAANEAIRDLAGTPPTGEKSGWDALTVEQKTETLQRAGWKTAKGGLNPVGRNLLKRPWDKIVGPTQATITRFMPDAVSNMQFADGNNRRKAAGPRVIVNRLGKDGLTDAERAAGKPSYADAPAADQGLHFASGVSDFKAGKPRVLPTYFTDSKGKNPKDWYRGWDSANAAAPAKITVDKAEMRPYRKPDGSVGYEAVPIVDGQQDENDAEMRSYEAKANPTYSGEPAGKTDPLTEQEKAAKAKMLGAAAKLAELLSKNTRANITPEQEQKMLPIVIELFEGAMELGYVKFKQAARYVRNFLADAIDQDAADSIPMDTLQGAYIATARRHKDKAITPKGEVIAVESFDELTDELDQPAKSADTGDEANGNATQQLDQPSAGTLDGAPAQAGRAPDSGRDAGEGPDGGGGSDLFGNAEPDLPRGDVGGSLGADAGAVPVPARGTRANAKDGKKPRVPRTPRTESGDGLFGAAGGITPDEGANPAPNAPAIPAPQPAAEDFTITDELTLGEGGQKTKFKNNIAAIKLVRELESTGRMATPGEQAVLAKYVGWGGLPQAFDANNADWTKEHAEVTSLMSPEELASARQSTRYAHYTSREIIQDGIYAAMRQFGFTGGKTLEAGAGVGNFIGLMPADMRSAGRFTAIEREPFSSAIARQLYPQQNVQRADFTEFKGNDAYFDAAVGNPPFASDPQTDRSGRKHLSGLSLHNYFFAKNIDMLREGGIMAQVVTNYFMDAKGDRARKYMGDRVEFLGAIRLPNSAFAKNANTEVTTDLIFLKKRPDSEVGSKAAREDAKRWLNTGVYTDKNGKQVALNQYFIDNPSMMLGDFGAFGTMYGPDNAALVAKPGQDTLALLKEAVARLPGGVYKSIAETGTDTHVDAAVVALKNPEVKEGGYFLEGGKLMQRLPDIAGEARGVEITPETQWTEKTKLGEPGFERIKALSGMRATVRALLGAEMADDADSMKAMRKTLNAQYDAYRDTHGFINDPSTLRVFEDDPDFPLLASLEHGYTPGIGIAAAKRMGIKPTKSTAKKGPIFTQRVVAARKAVQKVETPADALAVSMAERGKLDAAYIGQLLGMEPEAVLKELSTGDKPLLFRDPATDEYVLRDAYLSGNVRAKLAQAKQAGMFANITELEAVQPEDVGSHEIVARLGSPWVPVSVYRDFAQSLFGEESKAHVFYLKANSSFQVMVNGASDVSMRNTWGTPAYPGDALLQSLMNNRSIKVTYRDSDGKTHTDMDATEKANTKGQEVKERFNDWLFSDPERSELLTKAYNETNNNYVTRVYEGSNMTFPGKVPDSVIKFRRHQRNAIARIVQDRTALLDHVVGAGKTFTVISGAMELKRTGLARKPMVAVPNHLVKQWAADFYRLYPGANVLTATKKDFEKANRRKFLARIATGDWDAVVIAHSSYGFIKPSPEFEAEFNGREIQKIMATIAQVEADDGDKQTKKRTVKQLEGMKERLENRIRSLRDKPMDDLLDFEQIGVDQLFVDEAHMFKNLMYTTKMQGVAGLNDPTGSQRAYDMYVKTNQVMEKNGRGQGVVFATGTPVSNSLAEMYHMMRYLMPNQMRELGFESFDAWANTYASVEQVWMQAPSGDGFKAQNRMSNFVNTPELLKMFDQVSDTVTMDDIKKAYSEENDGAEFPLPKLKGGRRTPVSLDKSAAQNAYMDEIAKRAKVLEQRKGPPQKGEDNILVIMSDARKAAMDIRLVDPEINEREPGGRIDRSTDEVLARYKQYDAVKGTQLVFSDLGTPLKHAKKELKEYEELLARVQAGNEDVAGSATLGNEAAMGIMEDTEAAQAELDAMGPDWLSAVKSAMRGFSIYDDFKAALIEKGIPEAEIAFIHDYNTDDQKAGLFRKVNAGQIRVVLGSTAKMGAGTNVQERLVAEHHLDVPWRPSDVEQREGRIERQGNLFATPPTKDKENPHYIPGFEIEILAYVTKDTLDMRMWQVQETKLKMINQLRTRKIGREIDNAFEDMELSAGEMQAAATGDINLLKEIQLRNDVKKLEQRRRAFDGQRNDLIARKRRNAEQLRDTPKKLREAETEAAFAAKYQSDSYSEQPPFKLNIDGKDYADPLEARAVLREMDERTEEVKDLAGEVTTKKAPLSVKINGELIKNRATMLELFSTARGDVDPILWVVAGETYNRRTVLANAIRQNVIDALADETTTQVGAIGAYAVAVEGSSTKDGGMMLEVTMRRGGDVKLSNTLFVGDSASAPARVIAVTENLLESAVREADYLERTLERAKKEAVDLEKTATAGDWPDQQKLDAARAAHKEVLAKLKQKETGEAPPAEEGELPALSRRTNPHSASPSEVKHQSDVRRAVHALTKNWANAPDIVVAASMLDEVIPKRVRDYNAKQQALGADGAPEGFLYGGRVYVLADQLASADDVARVLFHETLGHYGLRGAFGDILKPILQQIATVRRAEVRKKAEAYGLDIRKEPDRLMAAEEVLAEMAQKTPELGFVKRAIAAIRAWLRENIAGFKALELTDDEIIRDYILPARGWVERGQQASVDDLALAFSRDGAKPLTESKFYSQYMQHIARADTDVAAIQRDGFKSRIGPNLLPPYRGGEPSDAMERRYYPKAGDTVLLVPKGGWRGAGNGPRIVDGWKPMPYEVITVAADKPNMYQEYLRAFDASNQPAAQEGRAQAATKTIANKAIDSSGNPDIMFSRASLADSVTGALNSARDVKLPAGYLVGDFFNKAGKLNWWHKSVGTMYNLSQRNPAFKRVYDGVQDFLNDVSYYATEAADLAPNILPKLDTWKDITKTPLSPEDTKAIAAPIFEGTLAWARDDRGQPVKMQALEDRAAGLTVEQKATELLRLDKITPGILKMWRGQPMAQFEVAVNTRYASEILQPGIVWKTAELKTLFKLTDKQVGLYREFRAATDKSLTDLAVSDMLRYAGADAEPIRQAVMEAGTVEKASSMLRDYLMSLAEASDREDVLMDMASRVIEKSDRARSLMDKGYAPLSRFGTHSVDVLNDGERVYFGLFESKAEAAKMARRMAVEFPKARITQGTTSEQAYKLFAGVSPETLELFGEMLGLESQGDAASAKAFQEYLKLAKSSRSAMKRLIQRKGITGWNEDPGRVLAGFIYSNARQASGAMHTGEIAEAVNDIPQGQGQLKDAAIGLQDYIKNPQEEAQKFRGLLFAQYLGGSVASAMVNMTQPLTVTFPYLSQFGGVGKAAAQMKRAAADVMKKSTGDKQLDAALKLAEEQGIVAPQEVHQLMDQANGAGALRSGDGTATGNAAAAVGNRLAKLTFVWGKLFSSAEQFNRRLTFIAAYRTAIEQGMKNPAEFAEKTIAETQFTYNKGSKPRWARGAVGGVLFTFKQYSVNYLELVSRMATQGGPEGKKAALLMVAVLFLMGGAGGLPFAEDVEDLIDGIMQRLGYNFSAKQSRNEFFTGLLGAEVAWFVNSGVSGLPGVPIDVSGRMGLGNLIPGTGLFTKKRDNTRDVTELAGPAGDLVKRAFQSAGQLAEGEILKAGETLLPVAGRNLTKAVDMANTGIYRDTRGRKVMDTDAYDALAKGIGFQPNSVARVQEATGTVQNMIAQNKMRETEIADRWALGIFEKDQGKVDEARAMLKRWNENNTSSQIRIQMPQIIKRVRAMREDKATRIAKTAPKEIRATVKRELADQ